MPDSSGRADRFAVHPLVRAAAEWSWRLLAIGVAVYALFWLGHKYEAVAVPIALAILGTAFLVPVVDWLDRRGLHRGVAVALTMIVAIGVIAGILSFVVQQFIDGLPDLTNQATSTIDSVKSWLLDGPFGLDQAQLDHVGDDFVAMLQRNQSKITTGAIATAATVTEFATGALLLLFLMIFFLYGGGQIWMFVTKLVPSSTRDRVRVAGRAGFGTLVGYVRATVAVAAVDAIGIGVGLAILQVPLALPLASLVFIGAFIPIVGALVTGALAVVVTLVTQGWIAAVIALAVVVAVMQIESHVLQPFLLGRSVRVHPVAVVVGIAAGIVTAGIIGGLVAVPVIAFLNTAVRSILGSRPDPDADHSTVSPDKPIWDSADHPGIDGRPDDDAADPDDESPDTDGPGDGGARTS
ncbi:MAG: AI-2E family transporter [Williamsia herbipolensis]|uniref:PurR-regulated permease PerM n=1 Tax=Williamsia serinedens TaxID=391736 RepID=A0ABT1GXE6_9NOCA|nr:AI-2E family transporter [Williamsia serinedens]MBE7160516.1 AI-2E family transporter [Williamsia herbipolensis]MCP2159664.1 putative PurR-regulated permease PerM [Williamsia serinedens]